ncbi:MAG: hypothetical protein M0T76_04135 [Desulfobacteraceae bacterium]|nr:hypothetical protein [Desulfobacteraceae bacterium]
MKTIVCRGLDGSNPLHLLAALGGLRLLALRDPGVRLAWQWKGGWLPEYHWRAEEYDDVLLLASVWLSAWLRELGSVGTADPSLAREVRDLKAKHKKVQEERKEIMKAAKKESKQRQLKGQMAKDFERQMTREIDAVICRQIEELEGLQQRQNDTLGQGVAHLGDIIGVPATIFRRKAAMAVRAFLEDEAATIEPRRDEPILVVEALAAQASDGLLDGERVQPTPFSFSNGASGQCLLKDFRACALACSSAAVRGILSGEPLFSSDITGLNWSPSDQRSYALQWQDPASGTADDPVANALAFIGLSCLPAIPTNGRLTAAGWREVPGGYEFVWPIWRSAIGLDEVRGLLAVTPNLAKEDAGGRAGRGIDAMFAVKRINPTGKRNYFAPAQAI